MCILVVVAFCLIDWAGQVQADLLLPGTLSTYESLPGQIYAGQMKVEFLKIYILNVHKGRQKALFFPLKKHLLRKNLKGIKNNNETKEVNIFVSLFFYLVVTQF